MTSLIAQNHFGELMDLLRALAPIQGEAAAEAFDQYTKRALALGSGAARRRGTDAVSDEEERLHESVMQQTASGGCL